MWKDVLINCHDVPPQLIRLLFSKRYFVRRFTCSSQEQSKYSKPILSALAEFNNLLYLNMSQCPLLLHLEFLKFTPNIVELNVSDCQSMSTASLIKNLKFLVNLQIFKCDDNMTRVSAYSIFEALYGVHTLIELSCVHSGNMQPWLIRRILEICTLLKKCNFTTWFALATDRSMYEWYTIV